MRRVWVYAVGPRYTSAEVSNWLNQDLHQSGVTECAVEPWLPFRSEANGPQAILLLIDDWKLFTKADYFALANALALQSTTLAQLLPIIHGGDTGEPQQDPWAERNRQLWNTLRKFTNLQPDPVNPRAFLANTVREALPKLTAAANPPRDAATVFFSYCHRDEPLRDELGRHLKLLERTGLIKSWHDRKILAGDDWAGEIDTHLYTSDLILLLLSSDFFASDYCTEIETAIALERHQARAARAIPVVLRPVLWQPSPLSALQALPKDAKPVTDWPSTDQAFVNVCEGILGCVMAWKGETAPTAPKPPAEVSVRRRVLDAAMPGEVELDKSAMLVILIRKPSSRGLRALLEADRGYGIDPEEVRSSKPVRLEFPIGESGRPEPASLQVSVRSPDFDPPLQERSISLPPDGDSQPVILMISARKQGHLSLIVELHQGDELLATQAVSTFSKSDGVVPMPGRVQSAGFDLAPAGTETFTEMFRPPPYPPDATLAFPAPSSGSRPAEPGLTDPEKTTPPRRRMPKPVLKSPPPPPPASRLSIPRRSPLTGWIIGGLLVLLLVALFVIVRRR